MIEVPEAQVPAAMAVYFKANWSNTISADVPFEGDSNNFIKVQSPTEVRIKAAGDTREDATIAEITDDGTTPVILGIERDEDGVLYVYKDNTVQSSWSSSGSKDGESPISNALTLTQIGDGTATAYYHEIVICNQVLSSSDRDLLYEYLVTLK